MRYRKTWLDLHTPYGAPSYYDQRWHMADLNPRITVEPGKMGGKLHKGPSVHGV
jgi:hypothetical protein